MRFREPTECDVKKVLFSQKKPLIERDEGGGEKVFHFLLIFLDRKSLSRGNTYTQGTMFSSIHLTLTLEKARKESY